MTSSSTFTRNRLGQGLLERWHLLSPAWRFALGTYVVGRLFWSAWSLLILVLFPVTVQNVDLFGVPLLAAFDLRTGERHIFSRQIGGDTLSFRVSEDSRVVDAQTSSVWGLKDGRAVSGPHAGAVLASASEYAEDVFPYRGVRPVPGLLGLWQRFDTNWYLHIAEFGYSASNGSTVFFPLYPLLIRALSLLPPGLPLLGAFLISNAAVVGVIYLLFQMTEAATNRRTAARAVVFLAVFPASFFLFAAYTESLFLLLALASMREGLEGRWERAGLVGALAALTRLQGLLLIVPLGYMYAKWLNGRSVVSATADQASPLDAGRRRFLSHGTLRGAALVLIPLATGAFMAWQSLFLQSSLISAYEGQLHAQFVWPWENVRNALALVAEGRASIVDALNLIVTVLFGMMVIAVWFKLPREYGLYALVMFAAPLFRMTTTQPLVSMLRYVVVLFPVFILWGRWARHPWVQRAIVYLSFPLALYLSAQYELWGWVG